MYYKNYCVSSGGDSGDNDFPDDGGRKAALCRRFLQTLSADFAVGAGFAVGGKKGGLPLEERKTAVGIMGIIVPKIAQN